MANWRQLYTAVLLNTNPDLFELVADEAARAMNFRLGELKDCRGVTKSCRRSLLRRNRFSLCVPRGRSRSSADGTKF